MDLLQVAVIGSQKHFQLDYNTDTTFIMLHIAAGVDSYSGPLSGVNINGANVIYNALYSSPGHYNSIFYIAIIQKPTNNSSFSVTVSSATAATDRKYNWVLYSLC